MLDKNASKNDLTLELNELVDVMLDSAPERLIANKSIVDRLVELLCDVTKIELHPALFRDEHATTTSKGRAVSMTTAAQCAEEFMRTQVFIRGAYSAITEQLKGKESIELLYGGTGPFGLIVLPLLHRFAPEQVQLTLLDIHPESLEALEHVIEVLQVSDYIRSIQCVDILEWDAPAKAFDVIVSETMKMLLKDEPQVSIFRHLAPSLKDGGTLIPRQVQLDAWITSDGKERNESHHIGRFFTLDLASSLALSLQSEPKIECSLELPTRQNKVVDLTLTTYIQVYGEEWLYDNQCSLNLTFCINDIEPSESDGKIYFWYEFTRLPRFAFKYDVDANALEKLTLLADPLEQNSIGIPYIKHYWQKHQLIKTGRYNSNTLGNAKCENLEDRCALEHQMLVALNLPLYETLQEVYQSRTEEEFCDFILGKNNGVLNPSQIVEVTQLASQIS
ncbi:class I SAM-dependent methyltransferase [Marinomonas mediterranea]|uniref:class I SAM-dependent methyltransferase n=1 Tax=Marinomonas mediterranea TaxID=119864 RepID=UPI00234BCE43|nr:class I SAM-dependent methyltransferase [Marinomonas mediterranea]WCN10194.1 methyltransferase domain-containing protein [Marinomonas mediterranea]